MEKCFQYFEHELAVYIFQVLVLAKAQYWIWTNFTSLPRKQAAYESVTRKMSYIFIEVLSKILGNEDVPAAMASRFEPGTSWLRVKGLIHRAMTAHQLAI